MTVESAPAPAPGRFADRFHHCCERVTARLPLRLDRVVAPTFLGFVLINGFTFGVDLLILTLLHSGFGVPLPVALTVGYGCAFALSYALNRTLNFRSHAQVRSQLAIYVVVVALNYGAFIVAVPTALASFGLEYHLARVIAGGGEAVFMYTAMRWVVFRR
ncbi:GtrA family protein [Mycolicibacterium sp. 120266]|uniref:GtrA family protein n=1 Tax=Mycolicibacterium sp. 120266 TaxID=3090601 RepID=UPI00299D265F|nr:GtrA family protein [Mycolicibacterium sp. 120266]MDX1873100.1 GtrA family protein [Mycolicibacterium sp. 120266]